MKTVISIRLSLVTILPAAAARRVLCDENCKVEFTSTVENEPRFAVVSPVGMPTVEKITQAPRLTTLDGKTIAIVGQSFMTDIIHPYNETRYDRNSNHGRRIAQQGADNARRWICK